MALLDTLDKVDNSDHKYDKECRMLQDAYVDLMNAMIRYQDESGMWYQVVNFGGMERNYLETSGSSIMAYSLLKVYVLASCLKATVHTVRKPLTVSASAI